MREIFAFSLFFFLTDYTMSCTNTIHTITYVDKREHDQFSGIILMCVTLEWFPECSLIIYFISEIYTVKR